MENWKSNLEAYFLEQKKSKKEITKEKEGMKKEIKRFMKKEALPAFEELQKEFKKHNRNLEIDSKKDWGAALVKKNKHKEFVYKVNINRDGKNLLVSKRVYLPNEKGKLKLDMEGNIGNAGRALFLKDIKEEDIISDFLENYKNATRIKK